MRTPYNVGCEPMFHPAHKAQARSSDLEEELDHVWSDVPLHTRNNSTRCVPLSQHGIRQGCRDGGGAGGVVRREDRVSGWRRNTARRRG